MIAIGGLLLIVMLSLLVTRVATVILVATGMSRESARFQARSALSGTGFTTTESEQVLQHALRRRVVMTLMLLGSGGVVAGAGSLILGFRGGGLGSNGYRLAELVVGLFVLVTLSRSRVVDRRLTAAIRVLLKRYTDIEQRDLSGLLDLTGDYTISQLVVGAGDWVCGNQLGRLGLRDEGVAVLGVTRPDGRYLGAPTSHTGVAPGDTLLLYGRQDLLRELDDRPAGSAGDLAHAAAVERQDRLEAKEATAG